MADYSKELFKPFSLDETPHCIPFTIRQFEKSLIAAGFSRTEAVGIIAGMRDAYNLLIHKPEQC